MDIIYNNEINNNVAILSTINPNVAEYLYCNGMIKYDIIMQKNILPTSKIRQHAFKKGDIKFNILDHNTDFSYDFVFDIVDNHLLTYDDFISINVDKIKMCNCRALCSCNNDDLMNIVRKYKILDLFLMALGKFQDLTIIPHNYICYDFYYDAILKYIIDKTSITRENKCTYNNCYNYEFHFHINTCNGNNYLQTSYSYNLFSYFVEANTFEKQNNMPYSLETKNKFLKYMNTSYGSLNINNHRDYYNNFYQSKKTLYDIEYNDIYSDMINTIIMILSFRNNKHYCLKKTIKYTDKFLDMYMNKINTNCLYGETRDVIWNFLRNNINNSFYFEKILSLGISHDEIKKITNVFSAKYYSILLFEQKKIKINEVPKDIYDSLLQLPNIHMHISEHFPCEWYEYDINTDYGKNFFSVYCNSQTYIQHNHCTYKINNWQSALNFIQKSDKMIDLLKYMINRIPSNFYNYVINTQKGCDILKELIIHKKYTGNKVLYDFICTSYDPYELFDIVIDNNIMEQDFYNYDPKTQHGFCFLKKNIVKRKYNISTNLIDFIEKSKDPIEIFAISIKNNYINRTYVKDKYYVKNDYENYNNCRHCNIYAENKNIIIPCGHGFICDLCITKIKNKCMICKKDITTIAQISM